MIWPHLRGPMLLVTTLLLLTAYHHYKRIILTYKWPADASRQKTERVEIHAGLAWCGIKFAVGRNPALRPSVASDQLLHKRFGTAPTSDQASMSGRT